MSIKFIDYNCGYRIVSLALEESVNDYLLRNELPTIFVNKGRIWLYPDGIILSDAPKQIEEITQYNNYDVLEIWENGIVVRRYNDQSDDNYFFISGACNSNCVMCPSPEVSRKKAQATDMNTLMSLAKHIPSDTPHLTVTGGEPFLIGESIFPFIRFLKEKFINTEFLFLTNGRIFSIDKYLLMFEENMPAHTIVAIPIHGSCGRVHDTITRSANSFNQTKSGIKKLLRHGVPVEIRLVVSKLNVDDFGNIVELITNEFKGVEYVSIIAMEMTGNAKTNKEKVWIPYKEMFLKIAPFVRKMIQNEIDVKLYNFPLCTVDKFFWTICKKSISDNKIRYTESCDLCKYKKNCGGVFAGTYMLEKDELKAII